MACTRNTEVFSRVGIETFPTLSAALEHKPVAVVVGNRTSEHIPAARLAAESGCDLFIEKPLSHEMESCKELLRVTRARDLVGMVGCNMRFHPALAAIKQALEDHLIGRVLSAVVHCGSYLPEWRPDRDYRLSASAREKDGGGVVLDLIHELDYLYWFFGEVERVAAFVGKRSALEIDAEDVADMLIGFRSGLVAQVHLDYFQRTASRGCRLIGEDGTIVWEQEEGLVRVLKPSAPEKVLWAIPPDYDRNGMYVVEVRHFLDCVDSRKQPMIPLEDGVAVLRVALAAKRASQDQRTVYL